MLFFSRRIGLSDDGECGADPGGHATDGAAGRLFNGCPEHPAARGRGRCRDQFHGACACAATSSRTPTSASMVLNKETRAVRISTASLEWTRTSGSAS